MTSFRSLSFLALSLLLLTLPVRISHAQTSVTLELLINVTLSYGDDVTAAPAALQAELYEATAAIFQGTSMNAAPGSTLGNATIGDLEIVRLNETFATAYGARCMDGSAYAYYIHRSTSTTNADKWLVYLQGGSVCVDPVSCAERALGILGSSTGYLQYFTDNTNVVSIEQSVNPSFYDWNIVGLPYCSGDVWGGSATDNTTNPDYPFYFAGYNITLATIQHLIDTQDFASATDIVLSGTSAGGIGVFVHVDNFAAAVPTARTVGYPQAGWFSVGQEFQQWYYGASAGSPTSTVPRPYYDSVLFRVLEPMFNVFQFVANPACAAYYTVTLNQPSNITLCVDMPVLYQFLRSPMFILENKFDAFQIAYLNVVPLTATYYEQTLDYLVYYGTQMITSIAGGVAVKGGADGYFIPACFQHPTYPTPIPGYNGVVNGQQAYQVFDAWYGALVAKTLSGATVSQYRQADVTNVLPLADCSATPAYSVSVPTPPTTSVLGDPQFVGLRGQSFQVHGIDGAVYNLISDRDVQLNARFTFLDHDAQRQCPVMPTTGLRSAACWTHPGSYLTEIGVQLASPAQRLRIVAGSAAAGLVVHVEGVQVGSSSLAVELLSTHEVRVTGGRFTVEVENVDGFINIRSVDVSGGLSGLSSHGLLGQTWSTRRHASSLKVVEGEVDDYVVAENDVFGTDFVYNQFNA